MDPIYIETYRRGGLTRKIEESRRVTMEETLAAKESAVTAGLTRLL